MQEFRSSESTTPNFHLIKELDFSHANDSSPKLCIRSRFTSDWIWYRGGGIAMRLDKPKVFNLSDRTTDRPGSSRKFRDAGEIKMFDLTKGGANPSDAKPRHATATWSIRGGVTFLLPIFR